MCSSPRSFGRARVVSHVDAGATLAAAMDLLRVATFVGGAVGGARGNWVLAVLESDSACLVCGTARAPDVRKGAARVDLQRAAALDVAKAWARFTAAAACMIASEKGCACSATTADLLQRVVADYGTKSGCLSPVNHRTSGQSW